MGFILEDIIHVNKNITKPVLDTSWLGGTLKYADSYDNLVVDPNFVKPGNIGIVNDGSVTSLYSAKVKDNKVTWKPLSISGSNIDIDPVQGDSGVYYDSSIVNSWTQEEMESHPAEILVVDEDNVKPDFDPYGMFSSMMAEIHALRQEVNILRNSLNDLHGGNIADTNSNYATYMHNLEKEGNTELLLIILLRDQISKLTGKILQQQVIHQHIIMILQLVKISTMVYQKNILKITYVIIIMIHYLMKIFGMILLIFTLVQNLQMIQNL